MTLSDGDFFPAIREGDFAKARLALDQWKSQTTPTMYEMFRAFLARSMGHFDEALKILTEVIENKNDQNRICLHSRADLYLDNKKFELALKDFETILDDHTPKVVEMLSGDCLFRKLFILARLGDGEFETLIDRLAPDAENFVTDAIYDKGGLTRIYEANKKPPRPKPRLT